MSSVARLGIPLLVLTLLSSATGCQRNTSANADWRVTLGERNLQAFNNEHICNWPAG